MSTSPGAEPEDSGKTAEGGVASTSMSEELDLDQVKGRMLTMAGLFDIWRSDEVIWRMWPAVHCGWSLGMRPFSVALWVELGNEACVNVYLRGTCMV